MAKKEKSIHSLKGFRYDLKYNKALLLMSIPGLILIFLFKYYPMFGLVTAFQDYSLFLGTLGSDWIGFENFQRFFSDPFCLRVIKNTLVLGVYSLLWTFPAPILLALMLNEVSHPRFKKLSQTITYLPYFISVVIIVGLMRTLFATNGGVINDLTAFFGAEPVSFFNETSWFRFLYISSDIWQGIGYGSIVYLAAITGIDQQLYEAAKIDGATRFKCIYKITIPSIMPTIAVLFTLRVGNILSVGFEKILLMYSPATYPVADVISTFVYRKGIMDQDFGFASAVGLFNSVVSVIFLVAANWFSKKAFDESLW